MFPPLILASALALPALSIAPNAPDRAFPYDLHETTLDNGLRVVVVEKGNDGMFALYMAIGTGSRDEVEPGKSGFAHFFEHIMFKGTAKVPADARTALLGSLGVDESGYTTDDFTVYHLTGPADALPAIVELEGDRYQRLAYSEETFKIESRAVLGEYNKSHSNPDNQAYEDLCALAFDTHTYKHTTIGFLKDIEAMPQGYAYSKEFFQRFYVPNNALLFVVGDVKNADVVAQVKQHFGSWTGKRADTTLKDEPPLTKERRKDTTWDQPTLERLHVAWRVPSSVRDVKAGALSAVLSRYVFSDSSALTKEVVLDKQLAESVQSWWEPHKDAMLFPVVAKVKEGHTSDEVLARVQAALDDVAAGNVDAKRFEAVKSNLRYSLLMSLTSADSVAGTLASQSGPSMNPHALDETLAAVKTLTPQDLSAFVKANFATNQRAIVTLKHVPKPDAKNDGKKKGGAK
jgi:zinc protease